MIVESFEGGNKKRKIVRLVLYRNMVEVNNGSMVRSI